MNNMKKKVVFAGLLVGLTVLSCTPAFAGQWKQDSIGWWWQNDDGSYPVSTWEWLDGNNDGVAECYYFDIDGYMLANTTAPDGDTVNIDGAWTVNGTVQQQALTPDAKTNLDEMTVGSMGVDFKTGKIQYWENKVH